VSNVNIFYNSTKVIPSSDLPQEPIDRFSMNKLEIGGRESHLPVRQYAPGMTLGHVPNGGK